MRIKTIFSFLALIIFITITLSFCVDENNKTGMSNYTPVEKRTIQSVEQIYELEDCVTPDFDGGIAAAKSTFADWRQLYEVGTLEGIVTCMYIYYNTMKFNDSDKVIYDYSFFLQDKDEGVMIITDQNHLLQLGDRVRVTNCSGRQSYDFPQVEYYDSVEVISPNNGIPCKEVDSLGSGPSPEVGNNVRVTGTITDRASGDNYGEGSLDVNGSTVMFKLTYDLMKMAWNNEGTVVTFTGPVWYTYSDNVVCVSQEEQYFLPEN